MDYATLVGMMIALGSGNPYDGQTYRMITVYEVWSAPTSAEVKKYSDAPSKALADKVAKSLKTLGHTSEVRGPVPRFVAIQKQLETNLNTDTSPLTDDDLSGAKWFDKNQKRYPTSDQTSELAQPFRSDFERFQKALKDAGATVKVNVTYRSEERAYLMHYAYWLSKGKIKAASIPAKAGVRIKWTHPTEEESIAAAAAMVKKFNIAHPPVLDSNHCKRVAVDVTITWAGTLKIKDAAGDIVEIATTPRTGGGNKKLHTVGASYGVIKLVGDAPHWSANGH